MSTSNNRKRQNRVNARLRRQKRQTRQRTAELVLEIERLRNLLVDYAMRPDPAPTEREIVVLQQAIVQAVKDNNLRHGRGEDD